jgi:hypothetical protein
VEQQHEERKAQTEAVGRKTRTLDSANLLLYTVFHSEISFTENFHQQQQKKENFFFLPFSIF